MSPFFFIKKIFWCLSQSSAQEDRSAEAAAPHGQVQRLCAYSAHPERSAPGAQRRCGVHIRGKVLYFVFTLRINAVAPQLNLGKGYPPNAISIPNLLFFKTFEIELKFLENCPYLTNFFGCPSLFLWFWDPGSVMFIPDHDYFYPSRISRTRYAGFSFIFHQIITNYSGVDPGRGRCGDTARRVALHGQAAHRPQVAGLRRGNLVSLYNLC
jgi:hypothetical protein